jgi:hypothetical protein
MYLSVILHTLQREQGVSKLRRLASALKGLIKSSVLLAAEPSAS